MTLFDEIIETLFTIHFATINTFFKNLRKISSETFTIHFATINTLWIMDFVNNINNLQYTLLLLIRRNQGVDRANELYLQYTLLLLIL